VRLTPAPLDELPEGINVHNGTVSGTSDSAGSTNYVRGVENPEIIIKLTPDEALVLSDWLEQVQMTDLGRLVGNAAVWAPLHRIAGALDKSLPGIFAADYAERLEAARSRLRPAPDDSASAEEGAGAGSPLGDD